MTQVVISGWQPGLRKVALTKLLQERASLSLAEAHDFVNRCLAGEIVRVDLPTTPAATSFVAHAERLGARASLGKAKRPRRHGRED